MKNRWTTGACAGALLVGCLIPAAASAEVILLSQVRSITMYALAQENNVMLADQSSATAPDGQNVWFASNAVAAALGDASATAAASQLSTVDPVLFTGLGTGTMSFNAIDDHAYAFGESTYIVSFELTTPYQFAWDATITAAHSGTGYGAGTVRAFLSADADVIAGSPERLTFGFGTDALSERTTGTGLLNPGRYWINAFASGYGQNRTTGDPGAALATAGFGFSLALTPAETPIPEPGTLALVAGGTAALIARRRARRRSGVG